MGNRRYSPEEKGEAVKLAQEIGGKEAAVELQIPEDTLMWIRFILNMAFLTIF